MPPGGLGAAFMNASTQAFPCMKRLPAYDVRIQPASCNQSRSVRLGHATCLPPSTQRQTTRGLLRPADAARYAQARPSQYLPPLQAEDRFNFRMCGRHDMYAELLARYVRPDFEPQVVRDPSLPAPPGSAA